MPSSSYARHPQRKRKWVTERASERPGCELTPAGTRALGERGVNLERARASRRQFAAAGLDRTERRPHLGGALGAEILTALRVGGYVRRDGRGRAV
jgi:hypothetical protein